MKINEEMMHESVRILAGMFMGWIVILSVIDVMYKYAMHETTLRYQTTQGATND